MIALDPTALPSEADVDAAWRVVRAHFAASPIRTIDGHLCKVEGENPTASFKVRGALAALSDAAERGIERVVAASAGNHGSGVAFAAGVLGVQATVVVPSDCPKVKLDKMRALGADVRVSTSRGYDAADVEASAMAADAGVPFVSPFLDRQVMAGNGGTLAREIFEQVPDVGTIVVPVGGGGLLSGVLVEVARLRPSVRVVAVQSEACPSFARSLADGVVHERWTGGATLAEGLEGGTGAVGVALAQRAGVDVILVSEQAIAAAMRRVWSAHGVAIEGSAAVVLAVPQAYAFAGTTVRVLTGANVSRALLEG